MRTTGARARRREVEALLRAEDFESRLSAWHRFPARTLVAPLLSLLCSADDLQRWRAARALGHATARLAEEDLESARQVMRRLMSSLTEESGAIGWGAPEAMAEIMARHPRLAGEFAHVLVSYVAEESTRLDNDALLRGVLWGIGRLAPARLEPLEGCAPHLEPFLRSGDPALRGLTAWALARMGELGPERARPLLDDEAEFSLYLDGGLVTRRVRDVALPGEAPRGEAPGRP